jgi:hypothetical protein
MTRGNGRICRCPSFAPPSGHGGWADALKSHMPDWYSMHYSFVGARRMVADVVVVSLITGSALFQAPAYATSKAGSTGWKSRLLSVISKEKGATRQNARLGQGAEEGTGQRSTSRHNFASRKLSQRLLTGEEIFRDPAELRRQGILVRENATPQEKAEEWIPELNGIKPAHVKSCDYNCTSFAVALADRLNGGSKQAVDIPSPNEARLYNLVVRESAGVTCRCC